jgi:hypothetical protein
MEGITGANFNLPIFDGTSKNPYEYLIDLDTDSMETYPDVRVYFYSIGEGLDEDLDFGDRPTDPKGRLAWDSRIVRAGREYLKAARQKGHG